MKRNITSLIVLILIFWLVPFIIQDIGSAMLVLLIIFPLVSLFVPFFFKVKKKYYFLLSLISSILFLSTLFYHYNLSALGYVGIYFLASLIGTFLFKKRSCG